MCSRWSTATSTLSAIRPTLSLKSFGVSHLEADVVHVSTNLANRDALRNDLVEADTYLLELKAAAIDVVAEHALAHGIRVVLAHNDVLAPGLDERLLALAPVRA